ncbi:DgaE family pyridoxal phosphate-dependent ammonia lyase [Brassicibacter mesophilus]|uniref:DgaE family pyridoxal phosphate-dependent ammonia lyase n=1 Tax=Brassicibacter mesophilus TaxID=745119 RepID=UPI003D1BBFD5
MNIYEQINLKKVINASGKMTALGASIVNPLVADYMKEAAMNYVIIEALIDKAGEIIASYTGAEDGCVTIGASAGIAISTAACIAKDNLSHIERLPDSEGMNNEVIIQKGHSVNFGAPIAQMIRLGGGVPIEVGQANKVEKDHIEAAINDKTVALLYVKSHHAVQKGMVSMKDMIEIAHKYNLPLIVDGAAEEDLKKYVALGIDLVIYSGGKAIEGSTSGFIAGKKQLISYCKKQYKGIGRAMKVGKENIMGLLKAIELYSTKDKKSTVEKQKKLVQWMADEIDKIDGLTASIIKDEAGREIYRVSVKVNTNLKNIDATHVIKELEGGAPAIYTRNHYANIGIINIDPRPMIDGDEKYIVNRLKEIMENLSE